MSLFPKQYSFERGKREVWAEGKGPERTGQDSENPNESCHKNLV
jgi:hypothetical protein